MTGSGEAAGPAAERSPGVPGQVAGVAAATAASRLLGLAREVLFAALLGAGAATDAFVTAFRLPSLARDLFAEGALSAGLVPAFAASAAQGRDSAARLLRALLGATLALSGALALVVALAAPQVTRLLAPAFPPEVAELSARLARTMSPLLPLVALSAVAMGALHGHGRLLVPAAAPALFNVGAVAAGLVLWAAGATPLQAVAGWALGTVLGGVLQLAVQLPALLRLGLPPWPALGRAARAHPGLRGAALAAAPALIGLSAVQVNLLVGNAFAARQAGAVTWLGYAFPLVQLPLGIFGHAVGAVAGAGLARQGAVADRAGAARTLARALRQVAFFAVPSAVGLVVLAEPIAGLLYQRHAFTAGDAAATARALAAYALGLHALAAVRVLAPAFYALEGARWPALTSLASMAAHLGLAAVLQPWLGFQGLALAVSLAGWLQLGLLWVGWRRRHGALGGGVGGQLARVALASAVLGAVALLSWRALAAMGLPAGLPRQLCLALLPIALAGAAYLGVARVARVEEARAVWGWVVAAARRR